ncbi:MAG: T9SS C-terminal target domain-containing protein [Crocinitomicaceae bacterium]|nr:T9SS C-terminal target domain-containing protein [Crocinitomicaceae bacterium]
MLGSYDGAIRFYDSIEGNLTSGSSFNLRSTNFLGLQKELGTFSSCAVSDIDNDGKLNLFVGQDLGGIYHLEHLEGSSLNVTDLNQDAFKLYPNPFTNYFIVESSREGESMIVFDVLGNHVQTFILQSGKNTINIGNASNGIYLVKFVNSGSVKRIVKR